MAWKLWERLTRKDDVRSRLDNNQYNYTDLFVNEHSEVVRFCFSGIRCGQYEPVFLAAPGGEHITALHFHRRFAKDGEWVRMNLALVGNNGYPDTRTAALFCAPCGLRLVIPERGLTTHDLYMLFKKWNSHLSIREYVG